MSESNDNGWEANKVYVGEVSGDGTEVIFHGSGNMDYTPELRQGVRGSFRIGNRTWTQRQLARLFLEQNPDISNETELFQRAMTFVHVPAAAAPSPGIIPPPAADVAPATSAMANEFEQEEELDIAQVLLELQHFREARRVGDKNKRAGRRTKRVVKKKSKRKSRR